MALIVYKQITMQNLSKSFFKNQFVRHISLSQARLKSRKKDHWHALATKKFATAKALEHFDDFYKSIFRLKWYSVRLGLLSPQKYVALVNNFGDVEETETQLSNLGAMNLKTLLDVWDRNFKEGKNQTERQSAINKVFELDRLMDAKAKEEEISDLNILYPDGSDDKLKGLLFSGKETNLAQAENLKNEERLREYESDRIIDPDLGIDSGSLHEFVPATKLKGIDDFVAEADYYAYYKPTTDVPVGESKQDKIHFPEHLKVYTFDRGIFDRYPVPKRCLTGVFNYFLMDGASLLPVLALGVEPGDTVLDMCGAPGGKSLAILQTMAPKLLVCNDVSSSRVSRIHKVLNQFLYDYNSKWKDMLSVQTRDGATLEETGVYDKILVDVPCTNDRLSLHENDNNIFKQSRLKERLRIPETQSALLTNALHLVKPGGTVVYSTCSLSPVQNDGVVGMALRRMWEERKMEFTVVDLTPALKSSSQLFNYGRNIGLKYGNLIVPFLPSNFGPMYFCKIVKNM